MDINTFKIFQVLFPFDGVKNTRQNQGYACVFCLVKRKNIPEIYLKLIYVQALNEDGIDTIRNITWNTALPYSLTVQTTTVAVEKLKRIEAETIGELEGKGIWQFSMNEEVTNIQYDWIVKTTKPWMNLFSPILRRFFEWNHHKVMTSGYTGLTDRLLNNNQNA